MIKLLNYFLKQPDPFGAYAELSVPGYGSNGSTSVIDVTGKHTLTCAGTAQISTAQSKFYGSSILTSLTSTGSDFVSTTGDSLDFSATSDFTAEAWVYVTTWDTNTYFISYGGSSPNRGWALGVTASAVLFYYSPDGTGDTMLTCAATNSLNTWMHICFSKSGRTVVVYKDGVPVGCTSVSSKTVKTGQSLRIGNFMDYTGISHCLRGYVCGVKIFTASVYNKVFIP